MNTWNETEKEMNSHARSLLEELLQSARRAIRAGRAVDQVNASKGAFEEHWAAAEAAVEAVIEARDNAAAVAQLEEIRSEIESSPDYALIQPELAKLNAMLREHFGARTKVSFEPDWCCGYKHEFYWDALKSKARAAVTEAARSYFQQDQVETSVCCRGLNVALGFVRGVNEQLAKTIGTGASGAA